MRRAAIGLSAHLGWAATACIAVSRGRLRVLRSDRLELSASGDREVVEPYHVAGGFDGLSRVPPPPDPKASVESGLRRQRRAAVQATDALCRSLASEGYRITFAGLLVGRGRAAESLERAIGSHTQIHVEEGLAVRESFRRALERAGAHVEPVDQRTVWETGTEILVRSPEVLGAELRGSTPENGGPWRKEEQTAALAAWIAWSRGGR
jgi:hypothetical protein